jgi:hypothetical protein
MKRYRLAETENPLDLLDHPSEAMETKIARNEIKGNYVDWLMSFTPPWLIFGTLTFQKQDLPDVANRAFYKFLRLMNEDLFGKHYTNKVGHSYFSYVRVMEYQVRGDIHFHLLINRPMDFATAKRVWWQLAGRADFETIRNPEHALKYILKYITKESDPDIYRAKKVYVPSQLPLWWKEEISLYENGNKQTINPLI